MRTVQLVAVSLETNQVLEDWGSNSCLGWDKGCRKIALETDSIVAVTLILKGCPEFHPCASMVNLINSLRMIEWQVYHSRTEAGKNCYNGGFLK
ncbi:hypothetical protein A2U01_0025532 [Trifolium medium]|uniref:RNase H type-1 domain-containing protein n=1 Tax=Trifolium medium TaxID=97028 RepID=A0A392P101_9FABA|nr:hypothetical protein [Trifolium medium]